MLISPAHILFLRTILKLQNVLFNVDPNDSALRLATTTKILPVIMYFMVLGTLKRCSTEVRNWTGNSEDSQKTVKPLFLKRLAAAEIEAKQVSGVRCVNLLTGLQHSVLIFYVDRLSGMITY
ncbi:uncharacterized protein LOC124555425 [Schistocerca americana]|uniref:uncharacterized protein LOC124555425 n=1 Tax=Schistocerca americana TaxID=7009 RepID=UPI001F4F835E|nr:uncharacterized protein LOC124555425 [Schistocerca americana]